MKKFIIPIVVIAFCFVAVFCGCSTTTEKTDVTNNNSMSENIQQTTDRNSSSQTSSDINDLISSYQPPAEIIDIDLNSEDPSNDKIKFEYDSQDRVSKCYYQINSNDIYQSYTYTDNTIQIYTFCGSTLIDDVSFDNALYSENLGFVEYYGYYFSNISFDSQAQEDINQTSIITEEEAVALVREKVGEDFGLLAEGIVERDSNEYYAVRVTQLVNEGHSSTLTHYFVKTDGSEIIEGSM